MTQRHFPIQKPDTIYLTEGGIETEIMYKWGHELPHFAMYPLLDDPNAMADMRAMYRRYLDVVAEHEVAALMGGLDYRASPDWGQILGYSPAGLADANLASIEFLRDVAGEYRGDITDILIQGFIGPRGDAYGTNRIMTADEAEDYHSVQLHTLKQANVDLAWAFTFNNVPEAIGVARAANKIGVPLAISLSLDSTSKLNSGPTLAEAITNIDSATDHSPEFYTLNCSHPLEFEPALGPGNWIKRLRGIRPNASKMDKISLCKLGYLEEGDPQELGVLMGDIARRFPHMDIWGGCCGTCDVHLDQIATQVMNARAYHSGERQGQ